MNITMLAIGSRGDVQPLVGLGLGLQSAGHDVQVATHTEFDKFIQSRGLPFFPMQTDSRECLASEAGQDSMEGGASPMRSLLDFARMMNTALEQLTVDTLAACQATDMIIYSPLGSFIAPHVADKLKVPTIAAVLAPMHRTRAFPSYGAPTTRNLGGLLNLLSYFPAEALVWLPYRSTINNIRQELLNLPPIPWWVNYARQWEKQTPAICGFSPAVVPKPADWGENVDITGYWFLDGEVDWEPSADLADFLAAGPPPVYIGFGSMSTRDPEQKTEIALKALSRTGQRGLFVTGWGGLRAAELPGHVLQIEAAPHDWLFPRMGAVVHHGGAGTTAAGLRAGKPTIIIPHFADQPFWGQRVMDLGVSPPPIPQQKLSVDRLAEAISVAMNDESMQQRAVDLGNQISTEDGIGCAVEVINGHISALASVV